MADDPAALAEIAEQLYRGSPEDFVARRAEQVKIARAAKDRELATAIGQLRRPTRSAWLVDLLADGATEQLSELFEIGAALQHAQEQRDGAELRELSTRRRAAVDALVRRGVELAAAQDYEAPESARQEVAQTLQAALADPATGEAVRRGVLAEAAAYGGFGFGSFDASSPDSSVPAAPRASRSTSTARGKHKELREQEKEEAREAEEKQAREALAAAEQQLTESEERSSEATAEADRLADEVDRLAAELKAAEQAARQADRDARAARKEAEHQRGAVEKLRDRVS